MLAFELENDEGLDYATLVVTVSGEEDASTFFSDGVLSIRLPLYTFQAKELVDAALPLSTRTEQ